MKITPLDIRKMVFKVRLRGYDRQDVDQFLEELAQTVETVNRDHTVLREKLASVEQQLAELKKAETTLMNTLVTTQAVADELKHAAHRDAELIMREAELKAGELLREAQAELAGTQRDLSDLRKQKLMAIERLRSTLRTFERMLEIEEGDEQLPAPADRPEKIADGSNR
jgi:cell division initiation protein